MFLCKIAGMPNTEREQAVKDLQQVLEPFAHMDLNAVVRTEELGVLSFTEARDDLQGLKRLAHQLLEFPLTTYPQPLLENIANEFRALGRHLDLMKNIDPKRGNLSGEQPALIREIRGGYQKTLSATAPVVAQEAMRQKDSQVSEFATLINEGEQVVAQAKRDREEVAQTLAAVRTAAAETAVERESRFFDHEAKGHQRAGFVWLVLTMTASLATTVYVYRSVVAAPHVPGSDQLDVIHHAVGQAIVVSLLFGLAVFCARNYSASRHNFIVNQHRAMAMLTFQAFVAGAKEAKTKDILLLQAAKAAFSPAPTGYLRKESELQAGGPITDLVRGAAGR